MPSRLIVRKSNDLVEAKYKLGLEEQKILAVLAAQISRDDQDFFDYTLTVSEFCDCVSIDSTYFYKVFLNVSKSLISKTMVIKNDDVHKTTVLPWLSKATYYENEGKITLRFAGELKPYLLDLKGNFTRYPLDNVIPLRSVYSIRFFELLKQYEKLRTRTFEVKKLKEILGIGGQYEDYCNLKSKVILVAYKELKEKCDIYFEFEEKKAGRHVLAIIFYIFPNPLFIAESKAPTGTEETLLLEDKTAQKQPVNDTPAPVSKKQQPAPASTQPTPDVKSLLAFMGPPVVTREFTERELLDIYNDANGDVEWILFCFRYVTTQMGERDNFVGTMRWAVKQQKSELQKKMQSTMRKNKHNYIGRDNSDKFAEWERLELEQLKQSVREA